MSLSNSRRPSPALIVAAIALTFAMVGTSVAQDPVAKITKSKVKRIAKKQIKKAAPNLSVARAVDADKAKTAEKAIGADFAKDATNAVNAVNAAKVNNLTVQKFSAKPAPNTPLTTIATIGTLTLQAGCEADGDPLLTVVPAAGAGSQADRFSTIFMAGTTNSNGNATLPPTGIAVLNGTEERADGQIEAVTSPGIVTTIQFAGRESGNFTPSEDVCVIWGTGTSG